MKSSITKKVSSELATQKYLPDFFNKLLEDTKTKVIRWRQIENYKDQFYLEYDSTLIILRYNVFKVSNISKSAIPPNISMDIIKKDGKLKSTMWSKEDIGGVDIFNLYSEVAYNLIFKFTSMDGENLYNDGDSLVWYIAGSKSLIDAEKFHYDRVHTSRKFISEFFYPCPKKLEDVRGFESVYVDYFKALEYCKKQMELSVEGVINNEEYKKYHYGNDIYKEIKERITGYIPLDNIDKILEEKKDI